MTNWKKSRLYNWLYAHTHSYFWAHCPLCGKGFGGHEGSQYGMPNGNWSYTSVCPDSKCQETARVTMIVWVKAHPPILDAPGIVQVRDEHCVIT